MTDVTVAATEHGSVLLTVMTHTGQQGEADLTIELAEKVKAQIETALVSARLCKINTALLSLEAPAHSVGLLQGRPHPHNRQFLRQVGGSMQTRADDGGYHCELHVPYTNE
jgi:hypothetical protein